jgi:hypothetical protein
MEATPGEKVLEDLSPWATRSMKEQKFPLKSNMWGGSS